MLAPDMVEPATKSALDLMKKTRAATAALGDSVKPPSALSIAQLLEEAGVKQEAYDAFLRSAWAFESFLSGQLRTRSMLSSA